MHFCPGTMTTHTESINSLLDGVVALKTGWPNERNIAGLPQVLESPGKSWILKSVLESP